MTGRSPARLLAPLALLATAVALFLVVNPGSNESGPGADEQPAATTQPAGTKANGSQRTKRKRKTPKTHTVQPGDTPSSIAAENDLSTEELLELNPDVDPQALTPGDKLKLER